MNLTTEFLLKRVFSNAIFGWLSKLIIGISGIILTPILISGLGKYEYGIWVTIGQIIGFLLIADLGVANSIGRLISKYDAIGSTEKKNSIYSTALIVLFVVMLLVGLLSLIFASSIPDFFDIESKYEELVIAVFIIMVANVALSFPLRVGRGMLQAVHQFDTIDIQLTIAKITQMLLILGLFYYSTISLVNIALVMSITNILVEFSIFLKSYHAHDKIKFKSQSVNKSSVKEIFSMGGASVLLSSSGVLTNQGFIILVSSVLGVLYAPIISIPILLLLIIGSIIGRISTTLVPIVSGYDSLGETEKIKNLSIYSTKYILMFGLFIMSYFILHGKDLFFIWLPSNEMSMDDIDNITNIFLLLLFPFIMARTNNSNRSILLSDGNHWLVSSMLSIVSLFSFILAFMLISQTSLGVYSVVIAWVVKLLVGDYFIILFFVLKKYSIPVIDYMLKAYRGPIFTILIAFSVFFISKYIIIDIIPNVETKIHLLLSSVVFCLVSPVLFYFVCLEKNHRLLLRMRK